MEISKIKTSLPTGKIKVHCGKVLNKEQQKWNEIFNLQEMQGYEFFAV